MKKITEETLNAIQENVRTRETQELDYKRDNLFKGSWKDFKIKDLKPNLIPDGWDSFQPYGSGKNYVENWDFTKEIIDHISHWQLERTVENNVLRFYGNTENESFFQFEYDDKSTQDMILRFKYRSSNDCATREFSNSNIVEQGHAIVKSDNWNIYEYQFNRLNGTEGLALLRFFVKPTEWIEIDWVQITPVDNQHLVVEKTPLGNGLTRIQTWGGNNTRKLVSNTTKPEKDILYNYSLYLKNLSDNIVRIRSNGGAIDFKVGKEERYLTDTEKSGGEFWIGYTIRTIDINENLDFIASDPIINEGDKPNPTMIVTDLDDGREHVKVYGTTKDTKLVYSGNEGFIGEDYGLKTTIENNGIDLDFSTSLTEEKKRIEKGENKVNLQGELSTKLSIEIGVPSE